MKASKELLNIKQPFNKNRLSGIYFLLSGEDVVYGSRKCPIWVLIL